MCSLNLKCEDCGTTVGVTTGNCPYAEDIDGVEEKVDLCEDCYVERRMDI